MLTQADKEISGQSIRRLNYKLFEHQQRALDSASQHDSYALFMETGTGKSLVAIERLKQWKKQSLDFRALVVCPLSVIEGVWTQELSKFSPDMDYLNLWKHFRKKKSAIPRANVYIVNFESLRKLPNEFLEKLDALVVDESSKMKNPTSQVTKALLKASEIVNHRIIMSGTPAPNSLLEYWSQMKFVDPNVLGTSYYAYRARNFFSCGFGGYQWKPKPGFDKILPKLLSKKSFSIQKEDCLDLPEQIFQLRKYPMDKDQAKMYLSMVKSNIATFKENKVLGANELAKIMKLRQITAGFFVDELGKSRDLSDKKLKLLKETLDEIGSRQAIIWCQFHWEINKIKAMLGKKAGILAGVVTQKEKEKALTQFKSGKKQYLIAHPRSGGHGLTMVNASYAIYFSLSYSFEEEKQSQDRIHRIGQKQKTTYIYLVAQGSIDEKIYKALRSKEKISEAVLGLIQRGGL